MSLTKMKEMKEIMMKFGSLVAPMFTTERAILWLYDEVTIIPNHYSIAKR